MIDKNKNIRLIDFGFSTLIENKFTKIMKFSGTPAYMPPEIIQKIPYDGKVN
jgi:serine/threonine protein kinase